MHESFCNLIERSFRLSLDLFLTLILNRMRNIHRVEVRSAERACLSASCSDEFSCCHRNRGDPKPF